MTSQPSYAPGMDDLRIEGTISKVDDDERQVFGWASVTEINGEPVVDLQGDLLDTYELEKAAYDYVVNSRVGGEMHDRIGKSAPKQIGTLIESMVITPEKIEKMGLPPETPHGWWIGFQVDKGEVGDQAWTKLKGGEYTGFSIHGLGKRQPIEKKVMDRSKQEIRGWVNRMAELAGVHPSKFISDLEGWMEENNKTDPSDEELHNFLEDTYEGEVDHEAVDDFAKHLLGRHEQKDHGNHSRRDHNTAEGMKAGAKGAGGGAITGGIVGTALTGGSGHGAAGGAAAGGILGGIGGAIRGAFRGAREGGDQAEGTSRQMTRDGELMQLLALEAEEQGQDPKTYIRNEIDGLKVPDQKKRVEAAFETFYDSGASRRREQGLPSDPVEFNRMMSQLKQDDPEKHMKIATRNVQKSLILKAAERASSKQEFIDNVDEIAKAFEDHEEMHSYFTVVHKHLIGRHEQDDHDPTKKKPGGHRRDQHKGKSPTGETRNPGKGAAIGAGVMGGLGALGAAKFGLGAASARGVGMGLGGSAMGYQLGGGQIFGNPGESRTGAVAAGLGNFSFGGVGGLAPAYRRLVHGDPNAMYNQQRQGKSQRKLSKRQVEILEKYLGEEAL